MHSKLKKVCSSCLTLKPLDQFSKCSAASDGLQSNCRTCALEIAQSWQRDNTERDRSNHRYYRARNRLRLSAYAAKKYQENKEYRLGYQQGYKAGLASGANNKNS